LSEKDSENAKLQEQLAASNECLRLSTEAEAAAANLKQELEQTRAAAAHGAEAVAAVLKQELEQARAAAAHEAEAAAANLKQLEQARTVAVHEAEAVAASLKQELERTRAVAAHETLRLTSELTSLRRRISDLLDETRRQHAEADEAASRAKQALDDSYSLISTERQRSAELADLIAELEARLKTSQETIGARADEASELRAQLDNHSRIRAEQSQAIDTLAATLRLKEAEAARDHQAMQVLRTHNSTLRSVVDEHTWRLDRLQHELSAVKSTVFWRAAAPIRWIRGRVTLSEQYKMINRSGLFDSAWYLDTYPDVKLTNMDPIVHYLRYGADEGRNPGLAFDTTSYLHKNPDIRATGINPLVHYLRYGIKEERN
jgi:hypothetical protein